MIDNILHFPDFTMVNRIVPKNSFYKHLEVNARMKSLFVENIEQIIWLYKLAPSNLHIADGKNVHEIAIFLIKEKGESTNKEKEKALDEILHFIDSQIPRHTLFILQQNERFRLLVNYKQWKDAKVGTFDIIQSFATHWQKDSSFNLLLNVTFSIDSLYESLVRQVASTQITSSQQDLHQAVMETKAAETIKKEMETIKKREVRERQPQKKFALHQEYLRLKEKWEKLG